MSNEKQTAEQQIAKLQLALSQGAVQVFTLREQLEAAEVNVKRLQSAIEGVRLGQEYSADLIKKSKE